MRLLSHFSLAVALATAGAVTITALPADVHAQKRKKDKQKKQAKIKYSPDFIAAAGPVEKAIKESSPDAKALVEALVAKPWTGNEANAAGQYAISLGGALKDKGLQEKGINLRLNSGMLADADKPRMLFFAGSFARTRGDTATAERQLLAAIAAGHQGPGAYLELANTYMSQKQHAKSLQYLSQAIDIQSATGSAVPEVWYRSARDRALATTNKEVYATWAAKWAEAYPSSASWGDAITAYRYKTGGDAIQNLEVLRFMRVSGALSTSRDYKEFAEEAQRKSLIGDVVSVLEEGKAKGVIGANDPVISGYLNPAKKQAAGDRASLPATPSEVRGSGSSSVMMNFADVWLGYNDYAKASAFYEAGIAKPSSDADRGNIGIGVAHALAGDMSAANAAFDKVSGNRAPLATMWKVWIKQQAQPTAPAPAPAPAT